MPWKCKRAISFQEFKFTCLRFDNHDRCTRIAPGRPCKAAFCKGFQSLKRIPTRKKVKDVKAV